MKEIGQDSLKVKTRSSVPSVTNPTNGKKVWHVIWQKAINESFTYIGPIRHKNNIQWLNCKNMYDCPLNFLSYLPICLARWFSYLETKDPVRWVESSSVNSPSPRETNILVPNSGTSSQMALKAKSWSLHILCGFMLVAYLIFSPLILSVVYHKEAKNNGTFSSRLVPQELVLQGQLCRRMRVRISWNRRSGQFWTVCHMTLLGSFPSLPTRHYSEYPSCTWLTCHWQWPESLSAPPWIIEHQSSPGEDSAFSNTKKVNIRLYFTVYPFSCHNTDTVK